MKNSAINFRRTETKMYNGKRHYKLIDFNQ